MKYVKSGTFSTKQLSITETIVEAEDVILIAKDIIEKIDNVPDYVKKELGLAINSLNQATKYLSCIKNKSNIALKYVPDDVQSKEFL